jgi:hypothetical protein
MTLTAAMVLLGASLPITAAIVELPLDCAGQYDPDSPYWTADFDLGAAFTEIHHVYIDWSGQITGALAVEDSNPDPFPIDVGIYASLGSNPYPRWAQVWAGEATYPDPELFDLVSEFEVPGPTTWSDLLDGHGTATIGYQEMIIPGSYSEHGFVVVSDGVLVVDGVIVPEPATILLLACGVLYEYVKYRKR